MSDKTNTAGDAEREAFKVWHREHGENTQGILWVDKLLWKAWQARAALSAAVPGPDIEALIRACVPSGSICDPQQVADAIRAYAVESGGEPSLGASATPTGLSGSAPSPGVSALRASIPGAWIAVEERLPDDGQTVLAYLWKWDEPGTDRLVVYARFTTHFTRRIWRDFNDPDTELYAPTHWMPVPEPPARGIEVDARRAGTESPVANGDAPN